MRSEIRNPLPMLLPVLLALAAGPALAGQEGPGASAKANPQKTVRAQTAAQAEASAPLNPRWVPPKWEIKGLVVWVFTPGHFERD
ncbi:hypothetical protein [Roseixanthobacter glucoisosaccharinicivorans]|uniref:hypothetical protein n=1 Tax=Roseixanthobacter glucoisosaccharinicivorans TaxID=3119923 RepID=UPI0037272843